MISLKVILGTLWVAYEANKIMQYRNYSNKKAETTDIPFFIDAKKFNSTILDNDKPEFMKSCNLTNMHKLGPETVADCALERLDISPSITYFVVKQLGWLDDLSCYNCLGWAMSEKKWLHMPRMSFKNEDITKNEADSFLNLHVLNKNRKLFNVTEVVKKFEKSFDSNIKDKCTGDGAVALYFDKVPSNGFFTWSHAAKYNEKVIHNATYINLEQWSSKLGMSFLTTHEDVDSIKCVYQKTDLTICAVPLEYE